MLGTFFGLCLLAMGGFYVIYLMVPDPQRQRQAKMESNVYKLSNGQVLARTGPGQPRDGRPRQGPQGRSSTASSRWRTRRSTSDKGVDFKGTARGILKTLMGKGTQGGSTITQQYVKNYYLTQDQTVTRKLKEIVISLKVDQRYSKDEILAGYMNTSYYGRGAYGIQAAAQAYYGKDVVQAERWRRAPTSRRCSRPPASTTGRRPAHSASSWCRAAGTRPSTTWSSRSGWTPRRAQGLKFPCRPRRQGRPGHGGPDRLPRRRGQERAGRQRASTTSLLDAGGWTITLNIDPAKQKLLENAVKEQLTSKLDPKKRKVDADLQAGAASVDPKTGSVVALYGGQDSIEALAQQRATRTDVPARLDLQADHPRLGPRRGRRDAGRQADQGEHRLRR